VEAVQRLKTLLGCDSDFGIPWEERDFTRTVSRRRSSRSSYAKRAEEQLPHGCPLAFPMLVNSLGDHGGFEFIRKRLRDVACTGTHSCTKDSREGKRKEEEIETKENKVRVRMPPRKGRGRGVNPPQFAVVSGYVRILRNLARVMEEPFKTKYFSSLQLDQKGFLAGVVNVLSKAQIAPIGAWHRNDFDSFLDDVSQILGEIARANCKRKRTSRAVAHAHPTCSRRFKQIAQLEIMETLLKYPHDIGKRRGMELLQFYCQQLNPRRWKVGDRVNAQFSDMMFYPAKIITAEKPPNDDDDDGKKEGECIPLLTYDVLFDDGDRANRLTAEKLQPFKRYNLRGPEVVRPIPSALSAEILIEWVESNDIVGTVTKDPILFGSYRFNDDERKRVWCSPALFRFLQAHGEITDRMLERLLDLSHDVQGQKFLKQSSMLEDDLADFLHKRHRRRMKQIMRRDCDRVWMLFDSIVESVGSAFISSDEQ